MQLFTFIVVIMVIIATIITNIQMYFWFYVKTVPLCCV